MPGPMGGGMRGPGRRMQGGKRIENPGKVFKRLMAYIFQKLCHSLHFCVDLYRTERCGKHSGYSVHAEADR